MSMNLQFTPDTEAYIRKSWCNKQAQEIHGEQVCEERFQRLLHQLTTPPLYTTLRINTLACSTQHDLVNSLQKALYKEYANRGWPSPEIWLHPQLSDTVVISNSGPHQLQKHDKEVIVGLLCGMAVLRGAEVFAQGIMGAPISMRPGDPVSVFADVKGQCTKGLLKPFQGPKLFIGNGISQLSREELFCSSNKVSGIGIQMSDPLYRAPPLSDLLPDMVFPQNLPSIVCGHVLDPQPGETILDMCAAPGGKTTHIATLMKNKGRLVALEKSKPKIAKIEDNLLKWALNHVEVYHFDSTKVIVKHAEPSGSPPYPPGLFDRVLLDAPCSGLGQRPSVVNKMSLTEVASYPPLQRKLLEKAVESLKEGGTLVYSTCTIIQEENEQQVEWLLKHFPCLHLSRQTPHIGGPGLVGTSLTEEQLQMVQRFDPSLPADTVDTDTIGFFCAKFVKNSVTS